MDKNMLEKDAFKAIHDLKNDVSLLSNCVDRLSAISSGISENETSIEAFLKAYDIFLEKYEESVNDKIKLFVVEIKNIMLKHKAGLIAIGIDVSEDGRLSLLEASCTSKSDSYDCYDGEETIFDALSEALLNAEIHMERFIPGKYLSYDSSRDYRILKEEGNIYTRKV